MIIAKLNVFFVARFGELYETKQDKRCLGQQGNFKNLVGKTVR